MYKLGERLNDIIEEKYGSVAEFARVSKIPKTTIYNLINRDFRGGNINTIVPFCQLLGIDVDALIGGTLRMKGEDPDYVDVPLYGRIAAGEPIEMIEDKEWFPVPRRIAEAHPNAILLIVCGSSMDKVLPDRTYALIDQNQIDVINGQIYALTINGYDATIKKLEKLNNGMRLIPVSSDPTYEVEVLDFNKPETDKLRIIGRVIWMTSPFDYLTSAK
ncbi:MAG: XRE family transcriptional regulator [Coriobacteriia bacterium]|nr:XRE family transcriptional regulator [Coriobacteriia bacterium]